MAFKFKTFRRQARIPFEYAGALIVLNFCRILPFKLMRLFANFCGTFLFLVPSQRKLVLANLELAFPEKSLTERKKIGKKSTQGLCSAFIEQMWFFKSEKRIKKHLRYSDSFREVYKKNTCNDQPSMFSALHFGNWEMTPLAHYMLTKTKVSVVAKTIKNPMIDKLITEAREFSGAEVIKQEGAGRKLLRILKAKEKVGLLLDQNTKERDGATWVNLFGLPVKMTKVVAPLARKFDANFVFINASRTKDGFEFIINEIDKRPSEYANEDEFNQAVMNKIEAIVRESPEQWIWMYERWNKVPSDRPELLEKYPYYAKVDRPKK